MKDKKIYMAGAGGMLGDAFYRVFKKENDLFCSELVSLHDLIFSKYELGTAIFTVFINKFCNWGGKSSNVYELIPTI